MAAERANQAGPAGVARGCAGWREDLAAYDVLPEELRRAVQAAPFEMDAVGLLAGLMAAERHYGSRPRAVQAMVAQVGRFTAATLDTARAERERAA